jgi:hypothetical protein
VQFRSGEIFPVYSEISQWKIEVVPNRPLCFGLALFSRRFTVPKLLLTDSSLRHPSCGQNRSWASPSQVRRCAEGGVEGGAQTWPMVSSSSQLLIPGESRPTQVQLQVLALFQIRPVLGDILVLLEPGLPVSELLGAVEPV